MLMISSFSAVKVMGIKLRIWDKWWKPAHNEFFLYPVHDITTMRLNVCWPKLITLSALSGPRWTEGVIREITCKIYL